MTRMPPFTSTSSRRIRFSGLFRCISAEPLAQTCLTSADSFDSGSNQSLLSGRGEEGRAHAGSARRTRSFQVSGAFLM